MEFTRERSDLGIFGETEEDRLDHIRIKVFTNTSSSFSAMPDTNADAPPSQWKSVRPWSPPSLTLTVREITSVSATFLLSGSSHLSDSTSTDSLLSSLGLSPSSTLYDADNDDDNDNTTDSTPGMYNSDPEPETDSDARQIISISLAKGLSVKVNGTIWQRVLMQIDKKADDAVVVVYGLMPGRPYDIDLSISPGEQRGLSHSGSNIGGASVRGQVTTTPAEFTRTFPISALADPDLILNRILEPEGIRLESTNTNISQHNSSSSSSQSTSPSSTSISLPEGNSSASSSDIPPNAPTAPYPTLEDRATNLRTTLSSLQSEHQSLLSSLKSTRKSSQKTEASLRGEIDVLKRSIEKHAKDEVRSRQRLLALQQSLNQTLSSKSQLVGSIGLVEGSLPGLKELEGERERELERVKEEASKWRRERDEVDKERKRKEEAMKAELAKEEGKLDRVLKGKGRLEGSGGVIEVLEEKLREVEREVEKVERGEDGEEEREASRNEEREVLLQQQQQQQQGGTQSSPTTSTLSSLAPPFEPRLALASHTRSSTLPLPPTPLVGRSEGQSHSHSQSLTWGEPDRVVGSGNGGGGKGEVGGGTPLNPASVPFTPRGVIGVGRGRGEREKGG
ncbi:hypothetical protein JAAARDRAFT_46008 [Jaapia argillacea MUCL 33604]|uniref:Uncharacterized protein n=1 Tax=Jaapia argillacea MUCL 33604 TaxID=933084 RepID=A0A067Q9M1_9AGAM|nr:hypothetical protein JAAARDRAFT_46008 [Jaapia argillacea MUCL 33604]